MTTCLHQQYYWLVLAVHGKPSDFYFIFIFIFLSLSLDLYIIKLSEKNHRLAFLFSEANSRIVQKKGKT